MIELVQSFGVTKLMRLGQLASLLVIFIESRITLQSTAHGMIVAGCLLVLLVMSEFVRLGRWIDSPPVLWAGFIARFATLGWVGTGVIAVILTEFVFAGINANGAATVFGVAAVGALSTSLYAFTIGRTRIKVRRYRIGEPSGRAHMTIAALSDLHLGEFVSRKQIRNAVEIANSQASDVVILLGDYVDHDGSLAGKLLEELSGLKAREGVFAVLGNHDASADQSEKIVSAFEQAPGISLLRNKVIDIEADDHDTRRPVRLFGIESPEPWWTSISDETAEKFLRSHKSNLSNPYVVVACHHPDVFDVCDDLGVDLVLSGHTHGGQIAAPMFRRTVNMGRLAVKYVHGLYRRGQATLIVSSGIGVGVIPARLGMPSEVTIIEITFE